MNLNVDSFSRIDYSDNESVGSVDSKCSVSSIVSTSSQISTAGFYISKIEPFQAINV